MPRRARLWSQDRIRAPGAGQGAIGPDLRPAARSRSAARMERGSPRRTRPWPPEARTHGPPRGRTLPAEPAHALPARPSGPPPRPGLRGRDRRRPRPASGPAEPSSQEGARAPRASRAPGPVRGFRRPSRGRGNSRRSHPCHGGNRIRFGVAIRAVLAGGTRRAAPEYGRPGAGMADVLADIAGSERAKVPGLLQVPLEHVRPRVRAQIVRGAGSAPVRGVCHLAPALRPGGSRRTDAGLRPRKRSRVRRCPSPRRARPCGPRRSSARAPGPRHRRALAGRSPE